MGSATFGKKTLGRQTFCQPPQYNERLVDPPNFDEVIVVSIKPRVGQMSVGQTFFDQKSRIH